MSSGHAFTWVCPACSRSVPRLLDVCRCGAARPLDLVVAVQAMDPPTPALTERRRASRVSIALLVVVALAASWWLLRRSSAGHAASTDEGVAMKASSSTRPADAATPDAAPGPTLQWPSNVPFVDSATARTAGPTEPAAATAAAAPRAVEDIVAASMPAVVLIEAAGGRGTGFFVAADRVVTNAHVVQQAGYVTVVTAAGSRLSARVLTASPGQDLALVAIPDARAAQPVLPLGSLADVRVGEEVVAIGSPLGLQNTVTRGIVSALRRAGEVVLVQTDAAINPGNSGGPLLDRSGRVVAVTTMKVAGTAESLGFGVGVDHVRALLEGGATSSALSLAQASVPSSGDGDEDDPRGEGESAYEGTVAAAARRADVLDRQWDRFARTCLPSIPRSTGDRPWLALWDRAFSEEQVSPACHDFYVTFRNDADTVKAQMAEADETARRAGVVPGARRAVRARYRLEWDGWDR